ncbi:glycosyltransferase [Methylobacterium aquaticum]|nr:glycosyltransferase [Methylobacterium aquaticum]
MTEITDSTKFIHNQMVNIFDHNWYKSQFKDNSLFELDASACFNHYIDYGFREGKSPHPLFSPDWYVKQNPPAAQALSQGLSPLMHFITSGAKEGRWPHPLFNVSFYLQQNPSAATAFEEGLDPLSHFIQVGARAGCSPHLLFDVPWYLQQNPSAAAALEAGLDPLSHFIQVGARAGCSPHLLFDVPWYLQQNPSAAAALEAGLDPLSHFIQVGAREGYWPHPLFNLQWYLEINHNASNAARNGIDPLTYYIENDYQHNRPCHNLFDMVWYKNLYISPANSEQNSIYHFIKTGAVCGNRPCRFGFFNGQEKTIEIRRPEISASTLPLVSIIIVNYNGNKHLFDVICSLKNQTYSNYEIVFVDNASADGSIDTIRSLAPDANIIELDKNHGFAGANNIGLEKSRGEYVVLLNNDTKVEPTWLSELVLAAKKHPEAAAIASKILFWEKFSTLRITSKSKFSVSKLSLLASLKYKKVFVEVGNDEGDIFNPLFIGNSYMLTLKIPVDIDFFCLEISGYEKNSSCTIESQYQKKNFALSDHSDRFDYKWSKYDKKYARYVVNNAGSYEPQWLKTGDRGFGEYDDVQHNIEQKIDLICGCSVLIKRYALGLDSLFIDDFVAYYEDSELSRRFRQNGFDLVYCPSSVVYHKHSATSVEKSDFWIKYVQRNRIIYEYLFGDRMLRDHEFEKSMGDLNHYLNWMKSQVEKLTSIEQRTLNILPSVMDEARQLRSKFSNLLRIEDSSKRVGVYNKYWNTYGGGEAHALNFVSVLQQYAVVDLISEHDFEIETLSDYFSVNLTRTRKRIITHFDRNLTRDYDLFINTTYMSETPSHAPASYFIVSFPSKTPSEEFLNSYKFIPNSKYTTSWMKKIWGENIRYQTTFPSVSKFLIPSDPMVFDRKKKLLLSIGRFFVAGHSKNQLKIVEIFNKIISNEPNLSDWRLVLAGSINDQEYFDKVTASAAGHNIEIIPNAPFKTVQSLYQEAFIYVHASGIGKDANLEPADFEHFGMTVAEAASNGCIPVVYDAAGPAEIIDLLGHGFTYRTESEFYDRLVSAMKAYDVEESGSLPRRIGEAARQFHDTVQNSDIALEIDQILSR